MKVLGISAYYHDSAAALVQDNEILAAAQEERFSRIKHDPEFPRQAIEYCLQSTNSKTEDLDAIVFYEKPFIKFERLLQTYLAFAPRGFSSFAKAMPVWLRKKIFLKQVLKKELRSLAQSSSFCPPLYFTEHHQSHAASAFYPSPFEKALVLCMDGVGEWTTTSAWQGEGHSLQPIWEMHFPHSLGLLYSAFTYYCGFKVNSGEYKLMGLAPYGKPIFADKIRRELIDIKSDGSFRLNLKYFDFCTGLKMTSSDFDNLFGRAPRTPESNIDNFYMDMAASIQIVTEEVVLKMARHLKKEFPQEKNLCLAGGVALNCVANGKLEREKIFENLWIQPAAGDAGGALGAALALVNAAPRETAPIRPHGDKMKGALLGPSFRPSEVIDFFEKNQISYKTLTENELVETTAQKLSEGDVVGWFQGAMEFGPRALGARSILGDPRSPDMQSKMNLKIKYRESFRPFAPIVLLEDVERYFKFYQPSPYMMFVAELQNNLMIENYDKTLMGLEQLKAQRSTLPAITHVDGSARLQTVDKATHPLLHRLVSEFKSRTGQSVLINTSFNIRGEPIVCTPEDAYNCFMKTEMDALIIENFLIEKQPDQYRNCRPELTLD